jgi:nucleotidyltransferase substrate binding protein (TIGR01987 family)
MSLDLTPLQKALASLEKAIRRAKDTPADEDLHDIVILRFQYSWELCIKMLKRELEGELTGGSPDRLSYKELIREGAEHVLLTNAESWFIYREKRNETAHAYDKEKADVVYKTALSFYPDAADFLKKLEQRNA